MDTAFYRTIKRLQYHTSIIPRSLYASVPRIYIPLTENPEPWKISTVLPLSASVVHYLENVVRVGRPFKTTTTTTNSNSTSNPPIHSAAVDKHSRNSIVQPNSVRVFNPQYGEWLGHILPYSSVNPSPLSPFPPKVSTFGQTKAYGNPKSSTTLSSTTGKWGIRLDTCLRSVPSSSISSSFFPWLCLPPVKSQRYPYLIEKLTELSAAAYIPLVTAYSEQMEYVPYPFQDKKGSSGSPSVSSTPSLPAITKELPSTVTDTSYIRELGRWKQTVYIFRKELKRLIEHYLQPSASLPSSPYSSRFSVPQSSSPSSGLSTVDYPAYGYYRYKSTSLRDKSYIWCTEASEQCERLTLPYLYTEGITLAELLWISLSCGYPDSSSSSSTVSSSSPPSHDLVRLLLHLFLNPVSIRGQSSFASRSYGIRSPSSSSSSSIDTLVSRLVSEETRGNDSDTTTEFFQHSTQLIRTIFQPFLLTSNPSSLAVTDRTPSLLLYIADEATVDPSYTAASSSSSVSTDTPKKIPYLSTALAAQLSYYRNERSTNHSPNTSPMVYGFVCGPEGGWHPLERQLMVEIENYASSLHAHRPPFIQRVQLSTNILRTETAAISALSIYNNIMNT